MVTGDDIPTDPDSRTFGLVRSAFGESWDFGDICSRWYDGGWRLLRRHRLDLHDAFRTPTSLRLRNAGLVV